jgi:tetratricopeptide (TPR) repeat protein
LIHKALQIKSDYGSHAALGNALSRQGKLEEASAEYRTAIRLQPDFHAGHEYLADILRRHGELDEAIEEFRIASRIDPACTYVRAGLADCLRVQGKLDEAAAACKEALRSKPDDDGAHRSLRSILKDQGKLDEVIADCRELLRLRPDDAACQNQLAWELLLSPRRSRGEYEEALAHSRKAVAMAPKVGYMVNTLALAELRLGHWTECIAAAEQSMAVGNGGDASDRFFLATAYWRKGNKDEARTWFDRGAAWTKEKDPKNDEFRQFWTEAAELLGQPGPGPISTGSPTSRAAEKPH